MWFPLGFSDLTLWTAVVAIILLITSELLSSYYGRTGIINKRRLRLVALIFALIFLGTVAYKIYEIVITP
jgi:dipeptide/tripeptide permease